MTPKRPIALPFGALLALAGCETMEGAGEDIERAGETLQHESQDVRNEM
ncbi:entericidin A/B family lipoprotein [Rhodovulum sp. YNF3179]